MVLILKMKKKIQITKAEAEEFYKTIHQSKPFYKEYFAIIYHQALLL